MMTPTYLQNNGDMKHFEDSDVSFDINSTWTVSQYDNAILVPFLSGSANSLTLTPTSKTAYSYQGDISNLTSDGKVVNCKMNKGQIAFYNKQISMGEGKDKVVLEKSYFERGTKLLLHGYRMGQDFKCKTYNNSIYINY